MANQVLNNVNKAVKGVGAVAGKAAAVTDKGPLAGFKKFISRGSMIDMAVGVVMGSAVTTVVTSIVESFINPLIAMLVGKPDLSHVLTITFNGATISFGSILNALINFLLVGAAVYFCIVLPINKLRDMNAKQEEEEAAEEPSVEEQTLATLQEIRDELKRNNGGVSSLNL